MNPEYALYSGTDRWFYDTPRRAGRTADGSGSGNGSDGHRYALARRPVPEGWESAERGDWFSLAPAGRQLPAQGWKIHVSATPDNAEEVLETVAGICQERATAFKFLAGPALLLHRNTKYADRAGSGKFVTVYPATTAACGELAAELADALKGSAGPVVLSDLRWGEGPVHVRYGAFAPRFTRAADGSLVPAVADPAGRLVPDTRGPAFRLPDWVELPDFLRPHAEARAAQGTTDLPYTVERALHFSNGGGVYAGSHRETGEAVVLKEGRRTPGSPPTGPTRSPAWSGSTRPCAPSKGWRASPACTDCTPWANTASWPWSSSPAPRSTPSSPAASRSPPPSRPPKPSPSTPPGPCAPTSSSRRPSRRSTPGASPSATCT